MIDAVITFLEVQVETKGHPLGQYIVLNFDKEICGVHSRIVIVHKIMYYDNRAKLKIHNPIYEYDFHMML